MGFLMRNLVLRLRQVLFLHSHFSALSSPCSSPFVLKPHLILVSLYTVRRLIQHLPSIIIIYYKTYEYACKYTRTQTSLQLYHITSLNLAFGIHRYSILITPRRNPSNLPDLHISTPINLTSLTTPLPSPSKN